MCYNPNHKNIAEKKRVLCNGEGLHSEEDIKTTIVVSKYFQINMLQQ